MIVPGLHEHSHVEALSNAHAVDEVENLMCNADGCSGTILKGIDRLSSVRRTV